MAETSSSNGMLMGMILGGAVVSALGATSVYMMEKEKPKIKTILRDFIIGAILVMMLLQIMPDSTTSLLEGVSGAMSSLSAASSSIGSSISDIEIQTGIPKF